MAPEQGTGSGCAQDDPRRIVTDHPAHEGASPPAPLAIADPGTRRVGGQTLPAIGSPHGLEQTRATGVVDALGRIIESPEVGQLIGEVIQTDAAINPASPVARSST